MITSMAEECGDATTKLPKALSLCVPVGCIAGLFFVSFLYNNQLEASWVVHSI